MPARRTTASETTFHVRYAETDRMGVVHHAAYLVWFEEGRSAYIRERGWSYAEIEREGFLLAAGELHAKYLQPARYDQLVTVRAWVVAYKSRTIEFACEVLDTASGSLLFTAKVKLICLNSKGGIARIPEGWSEWLDC